MYLHFSLKFKFTKRCISNKERNGTSRTFTHWGRDKIVAISQTTFWNACSWMKMYEFCLRFHSYIILNCISFIRLCSTNCSMSSMSLSYISWYCRNRLYLSISPSENQIFVQCGNIKQWTVLFYFFLITCHDVMARALVLFVNGYSIKWLLFNRPTLAWHQSPRRLVPYHSSLGSLSHDFT